MRRRPAALAALAGGTAATRPAELAKRAKRAEARILTDDNSSTQQSNNITRKTAGAAIPFYIP